MNSRGGMKLKVFLALLSGVVLIAGTLFLLRLSGQPFSLEIKQTIPDSVKQELFQSENPPFDFSFEYPEKWAAKTLSLKDQYDMAQILGPKDEATASAPAIFVTIQTLKDQDSPAGLMEALLEKERRFKEFKVLYKKEVEVDGQTGQQAQYQYMFPLPAYAKNSTMTLLKREQVFIVKNGKSYQISFFGTEEQFKIFKPVFNHALKTFKFLD